VALIQKLYPGCDTLWPNGKFRCNILQGELSEYDSGEDGECTGTRVTLWT
jgi:hypothetical protein